MSPSDPTRTTDTVRSQPSDAPAHDGRSGLRSDLEAVWAISASDGAGNGADAVLAFAAAVLQQAVTTVDDEDCAAEAAAVARLVAEVAGLTEGAARRALFRHASRRLALVGRDPLAVLAAELQLLVVLGPVAAASVWLPSAGGGALDVAAAFGPLATTRRCKRAAAWAIDGDDVTLQAHGSRVRIHAYPLRHRDRRDGALVIRLGADSYPEALPFLEEFAFVFAAIRERELLARASSSDERRLGQTYERRLMRTAFDLHDGPLQDVASLGAELRLFRTQIEQADSLRGDLVVGRIDDVAARLAELDHSLRAITHSLETSTLAERPLGEALHREADGFRSRTGTTLDLSVSGDLVALTMSQRIAVIRIVQEALSNIRSHSGATHVRVALEATDEGLELRVADNGRGFDLRATAAAAARRGRLGIVGMNERVRLLGGVFSIESVPGVGTTVSASIPAWRPLLGG
jgi:signal transduction histidine kinase